MIVFRRYADKMDMKYYIICVKLTMNDMNIIKVAMASLRSDFDSPRW